MNEEEKNQKIVLPLFQVTQKQYIQKLALYRFVGKGYTGIQLMENFMKGEGSGFRVF